MTDEPENVPAKNDAPQVVNGPTPPVAAVKVGPPEPTEEEKRERLAAKKKVRDAARKAFQTMWVAGTVGAFFAALTRNLPVHMRDLSSSPDAAYTLDRFLRYGYLLWLLTYFFTSNLNNERLESPEKWDIPYDVLQSACALVAAFFLGFIVPGAGFDSASYAYAFIAANGAIFAICVFALIFFYSVPPPGINVYRIFGAAISAGSIVLAIVNIKPIWALSIFAILQSVLWTTLILYIRKRLRLAADDVYEAWKRSAAR